MNNQEDTQSSNDSDPTNLTVTDPIDTASLYTEGHGLTFAQISLLIGIIAMGGYCLVAVLSSLIS